MKRCQALYHNNNNDDDDDEQEKKKKKRNTFVSFPFNDLTSVVTKVFIRLKSPWFTLPEPSNRNAISAWLGQSVKIIVIMFQVFPIPLYPIVIKITSNICLQGKEGHGYCNPAEGTRRCTWSGLNSFLE